MLSAAVVALAFATLREPETMAVFLEHIRTKYGLPSICAGAVVDGEIVSLDAVGVRRLGSDDKATTDDQYHCGSNTKSFTAALFATYVQQGKVAWNTPLENLFPRLAASIDPAYRKLTPLHFTSHRSGLSNASWPKDSPSSFFDWKGDGPSPRADYVRLLLAPPPDHTPETKFEYSNANYILLGAALEGLTGSTWEQMVTSRVLRPLGLRSAGFGPAGADGKSSQPWSHRYENGHLIPVAPGPGADNPETLGPAGTLHMSVPDLLKWCAFQADEGREAGILTPESFKTLHSAPFGGDYGGGLIVVDRPWAGGRCFNHAGSNTMNYENLWIAPNKRFGLVVATNAAPPNVGEAVEAITAELIRRFCPK